LQPFQCFDDLAYISVLEKILKGAEVYLLMHIFGVHISVTAITPIAHPITNSSHARPNQGSLKVFTPF